MVDSQHPKASGTRRLVHKYQGTGNDFVLLDERAGGRIPTAAEARTLCDRHYGVGADGVLTVLPGRGGARARLHITNADGTVPEMCGNGLRCVALFLSGGERTEEFVIDTDAGPRRCTVDGAQRSVTLSMGRVRLGAEAGLPAAATWDVDGRPVRGLAVDVGNPHLVLDGTPPESTEAERLGGRLVHAPGFPRGTNVEWVMRDDGGLRVLVHERGVGLTLACGTGAVASAFAARAWGWVSLDGPGVRVSLPGGALRIGLGPGGEATLTGPAERVFTAELG
ncbi:MAG: diaminopimelate epimerase [Deltaproteobacteria bacterium]|nr:diaminopimelate epimerase [Deltaproteobacteria bacterium]